jgi:hypothetical protein
VWIDTHDPPSSQHWQQTQAEHPHTGGVEPAIKCRRCGWITLKRWVPTGHQCLGAQRDWISVPCALLEVAARVRCVGSELVPAGDRSESEAA